MADAEKISVKAMKVRKKILGQEHEEALKSMGMVGLAYNLEGWWKEAKELFVQVMKTSKRMLGAEHPDMLTSIVNLASMFLDQDQ